MRYVLDASVAVKWVLWEADSPKARALRNDHQRQVHELLAPDIFSAEICHALTKAERKKIIPKNKTHKLVADVLAPPPMLHVYDSLLPRAHEISMANGQGFYDCLYVAL